MEDGKTKKNKTELQLKEAMCTEDNRRWTIQTVMLPKNLAGFEYKNENTLEVFNWIWKKKVAFLPSHSWDKQHKGWLGTSDS